MEGSKHSAAASALGYTAQIGHALLSLLDLAFRTPGSLTLELFDDVETLTGRERSLDQLKNKPGSTRELSDWSSDVWSTLDNWRLLWLKHAADEDLRFTLVTTQTAAEDSALALLRDSAHRTPSMISRAAERLREVARTSKSEGTAESRTGYLALAEDEQEAMLRVVFVRDAAADASSLHERLLAVDKLRVAVAPGRLEALVDSLLGWWARRTLIHLHRVAQDQEDRIGTDELEEQVRDAQRVLSDDRLPVWQQLEPDDMRPESEHDDYLRQLRLIGAPDRRLHRARDNYRRAYAHRSRWGRLGLVTDAEVEQFESALHEEWELHRDDLDLQRCRDDAEEQQRGMQLLGLMELHVQRWLRPGLQEPFVTRGTYHWLADRRQLGWHPRWDVLLADTPVDE